MRTIFLVALITLFVPALSFANDEDTLKKLRIQIQKQEKDLKSLESGKANLSKQIAALEKNRSDIKHAATLTVKQIEKNKTRLNGLQKEERELAHKSELYKKQASSALVFLLDNSGTLTARALLGGDKKVSSDTVAVMEILDRLNSKLVEHISQYNNTLNDIAKVKKDIVSTNAKLEEDIKSSEKFVSDLKRTSDELSKKMTLLKHDENAKKEHLAMLKAEQERLTKLISQRKIQMAASDFAKEKGRLPYPMKGRITEHYGEKLVPEAGIKVMNWLCKIKPSGNGTINAVFTGKVMYIGSVGAAGNTIIVQHDNIYYTTYSNLDEFYVTTGQSVEKNTPIGRINIDLKDDSSYLNFGVYKNQTALNPADWIKQ